MFRPVSVFRALRQAAVIVVVSLAAFCGETGLAQVGITGSLANFDVRYPPSLPNDIEIVIYGDGLAVADVVGTWNTNTLLGGAGLQWGPASSVTASVNNDPTSPAFGLDCVTIRYAGPPKPAMVGQMVHVGVRLRLGAAVAHQEVWWTINGVRILRPGDPHITWICTTRGWLVCIANPTPNPIYIYGLRYFPVATTSPLPLLAQLTASINPVQFGAATWTPVALPGNVRVLCIPPWCRIYSRVVVTRWRPIVFQMAARDVDETVFPLQGNALAPNPNDFNGTNGTMAILTGRGTEEFPEDLNRDGGTGTPDFNLLRSRFGQQSGDSGQTQGAERQDLRKSR